MTLGQALKQDAGLDFLSRDSEMSDRIRHFDWSGTPLGPVESWPQSLKTAVRIMLGSRYQMFIWWGEELINLYNDAYVSILGQRHPTALGQPAELLWHEIWPVVGPESQTVLREDRATWNDRVRLIMERNGYPEETFVTWSYSPLPDDDGGVGGVLCVCYEETDRVLAERRLATLRDLVDDTKAAPSAAEACRLAAKALEKNRWDVSFALIYLLEGDGKAARLAASLGVEKGTEAAPERVVLANGKEPLFWPFDRMLRGEHATITNLARHAALPGGAWPEPVQTAAAIPLGHGAPDRPSGFVVLGASPRLEFDDRYRDFFELVATGIAIAIAAARAVEDERRRLEALAEIDRAKTIFFGNVSHEFRTPLTLILGPLEDALAEATEPGQLTRLQLLQRNALRLQKLVNTLLDFARIEAGRMQASYEPTDLAKLTADLASVFRSAIEKAGMGLVVDCPPLDAPVHVDRDLYEKIVLNLLSNAFKYTLEGQIEVRLRDAGDTVEVSVADTGTGISEEQIPHIFERFHRVEGAAARAQEGTGIGLALVQELVKLHGGSVAVRSEPGHGSTFTVTLLKGDAHLPKVPIGVERLAPTALAPDHFLEEALRWLPDHVEPSFEDVAVIAAARPADAEGSRPRIVWADDNADMRDYVTRLLSPAYEVEAVPNGEAALLAVQRQMPDLVLADVMMPLLDGFALLRAVRADERARSVPVILLSARAREESRVEGLAAGADDYLVKPFSARELVARVDAHVKLSRLRGEAERALRQVHSQLQSHAEELKSSYRVAEQLNSELRREITERERAEATIRASEQRLRTLADAVPQLIWTNSGEGIADYFNRRWYDYSGLTFEQSFGVGWQAMVHPDDALRSKEEWGQALAAGEVFDSEYRLRGRDGSYRWFIGRNMPVKDPAGHVTGWFGSATEIQELKQAQAELQEADRRKNNFLAMLGHELRSPLAAIRSGVRLLRSEKSRPETQAAALPIVAEQVDFMERLIDDLLDLTRIVEGHMQVRREPMPVQDALRQALEMVHFQTEAGGFVVDVRVPTEPLEVLGDCVRLTQVFMNVLGNAVKYSGESRQIEVSAAREGDFAVMRVRDHGLGISPELMPRIFDPFVQATPGLTLQAGLGLGLAVVRELVRLHDGDVEAFNLSEGQGTELVIRLPLAVSAP